jgi:hypothetical protein
MNWKTLLANGALLTLLHASAWSNVDTEYSPELSPPIVTAYLTETISSRDYSKLLGQVERIRQSRGRYPYILMKLDSNGGSVSAALAIGRLLRKLDSIANVDKNAHCLSSCVYVLAGAPSRAVDGVVGIHRPFDPDDKVTSRTAQSEKYRKLGVEITAYLKEMNIPTRLYDDSLFISPERIKYLSDDEMSAYGLNANDPYEEEADAVKQANQLGISRAQLISREAQAKMDCELDEINDATPKALVLNRLGCRDRILKGMR